MKPELQFDGFYTPGPTEWEEWHAGVRMHEIHFHYARYYANGDWISCYRHHEFDFWQFTENMTPDMFTRAKQDRAPRNSDGDPLCIAGEFKQIGETVFQTVTPSLLGGQTRTSRRTVLIDGLVDTDNNSLLWRFVRCGAQH